MISSEIFVQQWENKSYLELMEEREDLLRSMHSFEMDQMTGNQHPGTKQQNGRPCPETRYRLILSVLSRLCLFMEEKYHREDAEGRRALREDANAWR